MVRIFLVCVFCLIVPSAFAGAGKKAAAQDAAEGKKIFAEHCALCHHANSTATKVGPGLKGLFQRAKLKDGAKVTDANVRDEIENGHGGMPAWKNVLSKDQIDDVMAYLKTL
jgi:mono/diheme cytochrome c family protein